MSPLPSRASDNLSGLIQNKTNKNNIQRLSLHSEDCQVRQACMCKRRTFSEFKKNIYRNCDGPNVVKIYRSERLANINLVEMDDFLLE